MWWQFSSFGRAAKDCTHVPLQVIQGEFVNLGVIPKGGKTKYDLKVKNHAARRVRVTNLRSSCECIQVQPLISSAAPNGTLELEININFENEPQFVGSLILEVIGETDGVGTFSSKAEINVISKSP